MPVYQVPYPPYSEFPSPAGFGWLCWLIGYVVSATLIGLWAVLDAHKPPPGPMPRH